MNRAKSVGLAWMAAAAVAAAIAGCETAPTRGGADEVALRRARAVELAARAEQLDESGKTDEAVAAYREAIALSPTLSAAWNNLGELLMRQLAYADAVSAFETAADLEPGDPRPLYNAGVAYQQAGWAEDALGKFALALDRDASYLPALRGAVRSAEGLNLSDTATLERIKRATLLETDERWRDYFERQRFRVEHAMRSADAG